MKQIILVLVLMWAVPSFAGYQEGGDAFKRGDYAYALKEFRALAENNDARGQYGLGVMHDRGEGVPQNSKQAVKWYRLSAEQGYADAQNNLGVMYENGEGVPRNYDEAMKWYRKAAELGNKDAPNNIGVIYMTGSGVRRDFVKASMWFSIAGKGDPDATNNKNFILKRMTPDEIAKSENLVQEWLKIRSQDKADERWAHDQEPAVEESKKHEAQQNSNEANRLVRERKLLEKERKKLAAQQMMKEADRLARERLLLEEERKKWEARRIDEENRKQKQEPRVQSVYTGTGFLFSVKDYVITNWHVIRGTKNIKVKFLNGENIKAEVVLKDPQNDIAFLKLERQPQLPPSDLKIGDSSKVRMGDKVFTIGYPAYWVMGENPKYTEGVVNAISGLKDDPTVFQVSVQIQPGNSGGPLFNSNGEVIGITQASLDPKVAMGTFGTLPQNVNYAIKSSYISNLLPMLPETMIASRGIMVVPTDPQNNLANFIDKVKKNIVLIEAKE